ncbi:hypothetical protein FACS1894111_03720 [Clostridia bacterium]|nr:hypothetical protein FACS1894111_03720 [Clostridia bacterium]
MREVLLTMTELQKYQIIKKLTDEDGNKKTAAIKIGCTLRHINRMIAGYRSGGKAFFVHGNHAHKPTTMIAEETRKLLLDLYATKYAGSNFAHYTELLAERENICVSKSYVRRVFREDDILSPKAHKTTRKNLAKKLREQQKAATTKKELAAVCSAILDLEDAHPRRPRCLHFGELAQMDASEFLWFGDIKTHLHLAVDDSTGILVGGYFDMQETLDGYYNVLYQILCEYGIPYGFLTDKRTVFEYKKKNETAVEKDTFTQFGYACKRLGIEIKTTSVPQAKGRVERMNATLQSRLPVELKLEGITTIAAANEFLNSYIKKFNQRFALPINHSSSVFEKQPSAEEINLILSVLAPRKVDGGSCIKYHNKYYLPIDARGLAVHYRKGTAAIAIKAFDGELYCSINDISYALEEVKIHQEASPAFAPIVLKKEPRKRYVPPKDHPWRSSFLKHMHSQAHRNESEIPTDFICT